MAVAIDMIFILNKDETTDIWYNGSLVGSHLSTKEVEGVLEYIRVGKIA